MKIYYSPFGGKILATLSDRDPDYEETLREQHIRFGVLDLPKPLTNATSLASGDYRIEEGKVVKI